MQIANQSFLVTGGAAGLGEACVRALAARGGRVVVADLNQEAGQRVARELDESAIFTPCDVTQPADVQRAIDLAVSRHGGLQGLVNCAGILGPGRVVGKNGPFDLEKFSRVIQVNLIGTFNVIRLAAAVMSVGQPNGEGERGVIVNTASIAAWEGQLGQAAYSASKAGVAGMTLPIARELARFGIRIVAIAPGVFNTAMVAALDDAAVDALAAQVPFPPRLGRPDEFAALACHIFENGMLNGSVLRLDGAMRMS